MILQIQVAFDDYQCAATPNILVNGIYGYLISQKLSEELQWKSAPSIDDGRQGLSVLTNVLFIFGGENIILNMYCIPTQRFNNLFFLSVFQ